MRGRAGPHLLATILEAKFGQHLPLNRLSVTFAREGIYLSTSTIGDWVGASTATITPLMILIDEHVLAAGRTDVGRFWTYVRDDGPFGGTDPPAAMFRYSRDRKAIHPERHLANYTGILQADAYAGFNGLYASGRQPGPILEAACWAHGRRKLFKLAEEHHMPLAVEVVRQIDVILAAEAAINGKPAAKRLAVRQLEIAPLVVALEASMRAERAKLSRHNDIAQAIDYMLKRWGAFTRFLHDGRICLTNNAAERMLRGAALGRKAWLFAGSDQGGERAAAMNSLIQSAKLNGVDPRAWLADVLARITDMPQQKLNELLPWNWKKRNRCLHPTLRPS
jgi:transposase